MSELVVPEPGRGPRSDSPAPGVRRGIASIMGGNAAGQVILIFGTLLIATIYTPEAVGQYSFLMAVTLVLAGVAGLRLEWLLALVPEDSEASTVWWAYLYTAVVFCLLLALSLGLLEHLEAPSATGSVPLGWALLPLMVLATAVFSGATQVAVRGRAYGSIGVRGVTSAATTAISQVALGLADMAVRSLVIGYLLGRLVSAVTLLRVLGRGLLPMASLTAVRSVYRDNWRYPAAYAPLSLLNLAGMYAPIAVVIHAYGPAAAGQLGLAQALVLAPLGLLSTAASQVFMGELTSAIRAASPSTAKDYLRASKLLLAAAVPALIVLWAFTPRLVPAVLGDRWEVAGTLAAYIAISACAGLVASPLSYVFIAYDRVVLGGALVVARLVVVGGLGAFSVSVGWSVGASVLAMSVGQAAHYVVTWAFGARVVRTSARRN